MSPCQPATRPPLLVAMFDTYMDAHALDPHMRRRMTLAMGSAVIASALAVGAYAGAEKLSITRVGAPHVEVDFLIASTVAVPLAAPPPESPPPASTNAATPDVDPAPTPARDAVEDVLEPPRKSTTPGTAKHEGVGIPGAATGVPMPPGMPCLGGNCSIGTTTPMVPRVTPTTTPPPKVKLEVIESRLRFSPDPSRELLLATRAGAARRGGTSVVEFCVGADGKLDAIETERSSGDADVDRICRDTLKRWRFSPMLVDGRAKRVCSEVSFVIAFE